MSYFPNKKTSCHPDIDSLDAISKIPSLLKDLLTDILGTGTSKKKRRKISPDNRK